MKKIIGILGVFGILGIQNIQAQQTLRLSLQEAQQYAVEHNVAMQKAELEVKKAEMAKWKAVSSMLPQMKVGLDYQNMCGYTMNMGGFSIPMNPSGTLSLTASMAVTGAQIVSVMLQDISNQMTDITRQQTEQATRTNVKNIYVSILVMEQTITLLDSSLANMELLTETSKASVAAGASEQVDVDKLQIQVATLSNTVNSTKRSLSALRNSLLLQLGADIDATLELTTPVDDILSLNQAAELLGESFDITKNYDYRLLEQSEALAKKNVTMAWMSFSPTLSAYYQYSSKKYFGDEGMNMTPPNMIGATLSWPFFTSGGNTMSIKSAKIDLQEAVNARRQTEDALRVQYNQLRYDLANALETYDIQRRNIEVTQRVFNNIAEKYRYGRASSLEVTNASTDIISAQSNYIQSVMSVVSAQMALENLLNQ